MDIQFDVTGHMKVLQQLADELTEQGNIVQLSESDELLPIPVLSVYMDGEDEEESGEENFTLEARLSLVQEGLPDDNGLLILVMIVETGIEIDMDDPEDDGYSSLLGLLPMMNNLQTMGYFNIMPHGSLVYRNTFIGRAEDGFDASAIDELIDYAFMQVLHYGEIIFDFLEGDIDITQAATAIVEGYDEEDWDADETWEADENEEDYGTEADDSGDDSKIRPIR